MIELKKADISSPAFGKGGIECQLTVSHHVREVPQEELLLKRHGGRCDHQFFLPGTRDRQRSDKIGDRFARTRAGFYHRNRGFSFRITERVSDLGNHLPLPPPWHQSHGLS